MQKFETLLNAEFDVRQAQAAVRMKKEGMLQTAATLQVLEGELDAAFTAYDAVRIQFTAEEARAYRAYRDAAAAKNGWRW